MKKSKKIISLVILIILFIVISTFIILNKVIAVSFPGFIKEKAKTYDEIMKYTPNALEDYTFYDGNNGSWQYYTQVLCFEGANMVMNNDHTLKSYIVIDINKEGDNPTGYTLYVDGKEKRSGKSSHAAELAYLSKYCEASYYNENDATIRKNTFIKSWKEGLRNELYGLDITLPDTTDTVLSYYDAILQAAQTYAETCETDSDKVYQARIIFCSGGWSQSRGLVYGKEIDRPINSEIVINKYITNVEYDKDYRYDLYGTGDKYDIVNLEKDRSTLGEFSKAISPVIVRHSGVKITYKITIENVGKNTIKGTFTDELLGNKRDKFIGSESVFLNPSITEKEITIDGGKTLTFSITVDGRYSTFAGPLGNRAKFTYSSSNGKKKQKISFDYLKVEPIERIKIEKYIYWVQDKRFKDGHGDILLGDTRSREGLEIGTFVDKFLNPVETAHGNITVHYKVKVTNNGSIPLSGTLTDGKYVRTVFNEEEGKSEDIVDCSYDTRFLSNLTGLDKEGKIKYLKVGDTKVFEDITLDGNPKVTDSAVYEPAIPDVNPTGGVFQNEALFRSDLTGRIYGDGDYIKVVPEKGQEINKIITEIDNVKNGTIIDKTQYDREEMSEEDKEKKENIVDAGYNDVDKKVTYKVDISVKNHDVVSGVFKDIPDNGIKIDKMMMEQNNTSTEINNETVLNITCKTPVVITIEATIEKGINPGIYRNTAKLTLYKTLNEAVNGTGDETVDKIGRVIESSDYLKIDYNPIRKGELKKYITGIESVNNRENSTSKVFESVYKNREMQGRDWKYQHPVEVEQGDIITYRVDLTFNMYDPNLSAFDDNGNLCPYHYDNRTNLYENRKISLSCDDIFNSACLEFMPDESAKNVTYENSGEVKIKWTDIEVEDVSKEQTITVSAELKFKVIAPKLVCVDIENKVQNIIYQYTRWTCLVTHGDWHEETTANYGYGKVCDHKNCKFIHKYIPIGGRLECQDSDFVRILDPEIGGRVFLDRDENNLYDGENEDIKNMSKDQYKKISVELWRKRDGEEDKCIATKEVNRETGEYSFGRVKRSPYMVITENTSNNYDYDIGEGNYFYYKSTRFNK